MSDSKTTKYFSILSHTIRQDILRFIHEKSPVLFTDLNIRFQLDVGTLYYHLKVLKPLIQQDRNHRYYLSDEGKAAYQLIIQKLFPDKIESMQPISKQQLAIKSLLLFPLIKYITKDTRRSFLEAIFIVVLSGISTYFIGQQPELLFYTISNQTQPWNIIGGMFVRWLYIFTIVQVFSRWVFHRKGDEIKLLTAIPFCTLPLAFYPLVWISLQIILQQYYIFADLFLQLLFQIWSLGSLTLMISYIKDLRIERAGLIAIFLQYINIVIIWIITFIL